MFCLTATQVGWWLDLSAREVIQRARDGKLESLFLSNDEPFFHLDVVVDAILADGDVRFMGGGTLRTADGHMSFEVVEPTYRLENFGEWCAVFQGRDGSWHLRPAVTSYVPLPYAPDGFDLVLDCRGNNAPETQYKDLPELFSAHYNFFKKLRRRRNAPGVCGSMEPQSRPDACHRAT